MAPIKFEDHLREKLQERELQPSSKAWDKLTDALGEEPREQSKKLWFYGVAASLLIALIAGRLFFGSSEAIEGTPELVEESPVEQIEDLEESIQILEPETEQVQGTPVLAEIEEASLDRIQEKKDLQPEEDLVISEPLMPEQVVITAAAEESPNRLDVGAAQPEIVDPMTNAKVAEVVEAVLALQVQNNTVTPEEIDALLAQANRDLANRRLLEQADGKIDPMALLNDVELELEQSFRDRVFEALGSGFDKVRTAVVDRNN